MTPEMERALRLNPRLRKRLRCARAGSPRQVGIARIASGGRSDRRDYLAPCRTDNGSAMHRQSC
jgi:hypothetical protein